MYGTKPLYKKIAELLEAIANCEASHNWEWKQKHMDTLYSLVKSRMPSGAGFDYGTNIHGLSKANELVFTVSFHHMDKNGYYDGWTEHTVIVRPDLVSDFTILVTGENRNEIKDYIHEVFDSTLRKEVD